MKLNDAYKSDNWRTMQKLDAHCRSHFQEMVEALENARSFILRFENARSFILRNNDPDDGELKESKKISNLLKKVTKVRV